jgi:hypothetical protein
VRIGGRLENSAVCLLIPERVWQSMPAFPGIYFYSVFFFCLDPFAISHRAMLHMECHHSPSEHTTIIFSCRGNTFHAVLIAFNSPPRFAAFNRFSENIPVRMLTEL